MRCRPFVWFNSTQLKMCLLLPSNNIIKQRHITVITRTKKITPTIQFTKIFNGDMLLCTIINHCQDVCIQNMFTVITSCFLKNMHQSCQRSMIFNITIQIHDKISSISGETHFCRIWFRINHLLQGSHFTIKV